MLKNPATGCIVASLLVMAATGAPAAAGSSTGSQRPGLQISRISLSAPGEVLVEGTYTGRHAKTFSAGVTTVGVVPCSKGASDVIAELHPNSKTLLDYQPFDKEIKGRTVAYRAKLSCAVPYQGPRSPKTNPVEHYLAGRPDWNTACLSIERVGMFGRGHALARTQPGALAPMASLCAGEPPPR